MNRPYGQGPRNGPLDIGPRNNLCLIREDQKGILRNLTHFLRAERTVKTRLSSAELPLLVNHKITKLDYLTFVRPVQKELKK